MQSVSRICPEIVVGCAQAPTTATSRSTSSDWPAPPHKGHQAPHGSYSTASTETRSPTYGQERRGRRICSPSRTSTSPPAGTATRFFDAVGGQLDGHFAFEDADSGYLLLNELLYGEETSKLARFLLEDFKQYVAARKQEGHQVLLIVDEFSAIASGERVARLVEIVRSYGASLVLAPQAYEGMGGDEAAARILNAAHTIILHAVPEPEPLIRAAGTKIEIEASVQHDAGRSLDIGSARAQHQYKVSPNDVRALHPGACFVIGSGKAQKIQGRADQHHGHPSQASDEIRRDPCSRSAGRHLQATRRPAAAMNGDAMSTRPVDAGENGSREALAEPLLDAAAAARLLSVRPSWIYEAVRAGRLPHLKIGRHTRFLRSDLESWVLTRRVGGSVAPRGRQRR